MRAFKGIRRRLEIVGVHRGVTVIDDFAHHPTAVRETLAALRMGYPSRRLWAVFEPRSASSCRRVFQDEFASSFGAADEVVIRRDLSVVPAGVGTPVRESDWSMTCADKDQRARHIPGVQEIVETIVNEHRDGDLVVLMSNGGFDGIHQKLLQALDG